MALVTNKRPITIPVAIQPVGRTGLELLTSKLGESGLRIALFHKDECAASTYDIPTLRSSEDLVYQVARRLVDQVRPQAGPHVAYEVARQITNAIKEYQ